jgi:hypothetical protein
MDGTATFSTSALPAGSDSITAVYGGDTNFSISTSNSVTQSVAQRGLVITADNATNVEGNTLTFAGTEFTTAGTGGALGLVNGDTVTSVTLTSAGAAATAEDGSYAITPSAAVGTGLANYAITYQPGTLTVTEPTIVGASDTLAPVVTGQAPTAVEVATFTHANGVEPAGNFTATVNWGIAGHTADPAAITEDGSGSYHVSATGPAFNAGTYTVTVSISEDNVSTTVTDTQVVNQASTSTALASSLNPSAFGQSVTFTATVSASAPGAGTPTGTVSFLDGTKTIGTGTLSGGVATFSTSALAVGGHSITASYGGDPNFTGSTSAALTQTVKAYASTASVTSSANPSVYGQNVTFTATVKAASGTLTPTGTVEFLDGTTVIGTATLSAGKATLKTSALAVGGHSITVVYGGDTNFTGSTSAALTQTVNRDGTTTRVTSSSRPSVFGQSVTFTATVSAVTPGSGTPTGTVTFMDGTTTLGTGTLSGGVATLTTSSLAFGSHSITAVYSADTNFTGSTSAALTQTVNADPTTTVLTSSLNPSTSGQSVTFTATVTANAPGSGTPGGTVTFKDGIKTIGTGTLSGGVATFTTSTLAVGSHSITAVYGASTDFKASTSAAVTQVVNPSGGAVVNAGSPTLATSTLAQALVQSSAPPPSTAAGPNMVSTANVSVSQPASLSPTGVTDTVLAALGGSSNDAQYPSQLATLDHVFAMLGKGWPTGGNQGTEDEEG